MKYLLGLILLMPHCFTSGAENPPWVQEARQLIGVGEKERATAIRKLRKMSSLKEILRSSLEGPYKYYAFDVISILRFEDFVDDLLLVSKNDTNGAAYLAVNTLISDHNVSKIEKTYRERLLSPGELTAPVTVVLLDTLARMGSLLPLEMLKDFLKSSSFEIRNSVLYYCGAVLKSRNALRYFEIIRLSLKGTPYQLRLQAVALLKELSEKQSPLPFDLKPLCRNDRNIEVKNLCLSL